MAATGVPDRIGQYGPRETHDYRNYNLLGSGTIQSKKKQKTRNSKPIPTSGARP